MLVFLRCKAKVHVKLFEMPEMLKMVVVLGGFTFYLTFVGKKQAGSEILGQKSLMYYKLNYSPYFCSISGRDSSPVY